MVILRSEYFHIAAFPVTCSSANQFAHLQWGQSSNIPVYYDYFLFSRVISAWRASVCSKAALSVSNYEVSSGSNKRQEEPWNWSWYMI